MARSSRLWQVSSGYVGTAFGRGPRSPTISSPSPIQNVFSSHRKRNARARSTGADQRPRLSR